MWVCLSAGSHVAKCLLYMWVYSNYNKYQFYLFQDWWNRHLKTIEHSTEIRGWLKEDTYLCHPHSYVYHNIVNRHVLMNDTKMWDFKSFVYGSKLQYWVKIGWLSHCSFEAKVFIWQDMVGGFLVGDALRRRNIIDRMCFICIVVVEHNQHQFFYGVQWQHILEVLSYLVVFPLRPF